MLNNYLFLQHYWWFLISTLGSILVFLLFVQGGQTLIYTLGKTEQERAVLVNTLGRKWEFTFTTLVVFGGAFFASFPLFYSTSFGGAYWVWIAILFCFTVQAVSYEYRSKPNNFLGKRVYEVFLFINGLVGTILLGTAVSTFFTGSLFSVNKLNITDPGNPVISQWETPWHGLEAILNVQNVVLGLTVFFLARTIALMYFLKNIGEESILLRTRRHLWYNAVPFLVLFVLFVVLLLTREGFAYDPVTKTVFMEPFKYLHNLLQMPVVGLTFLLGVVLVLLGAYRALIKACENSIWFAGPGVILTVLALFLIAGYNHTAFYPSVYDLQSSLTIENSSSSLYTLKTMTFVSFLLPAVAAYMIYAWRAINKKKVDTAELNENTHVY
ncbi:MAG: cytochrome d ubiquinol oxidase subunit II [Bacteroidales bacterium]|nr:cytochrome d ubiquinol oxidase subunit II [Bacteroidales bacterium]